MKIKNSIAILMVITLAGCGNDPYRGMYDAVKSRNESTRTPTERSVTPTPSYDQYKKEREQQQ